MNMRFKIFLSVPFTDSKGVTYRNHKVFIKNKPYWFSEKDYVNQPELLLINDNQILIAETQKDLYEIKKSSKKNGEFYSVIPLYEIDKTPTKANIEEHNQITLGSILKTVIPFKEPDFFDEPDFDEPDFDEPDFDEPDFLDEPDIKNAVYRGTAENLPSIYKHLLDNNEQQIKTDAESTNDPDINEMDEPDVSKAVVRGSFKNLLSSFDHQLATVRDIKQTDSSNILLEEFMDMDDVFPEQIEGNGKKSSLSFKQKIDLIESKQHQQTIPLDAKIQFINGLVSMASRDKVNDHLRERLVSLVSKELEGQKGHEDKILDEINNIKKILLQSQTVPPSTSDTGDLPEYISPNYLYKFLLEYNTDPILKYTCHEIQDESVLDTIVALSQNTKYKYTDHLAIIRNAYKSLTKKHKVNKRIWSLINNYINGPNEWSSDNIPINWSSPEIIEWSFNNPEKVPNPGGPLVHKTKNKGFTFSKPIYSGLTGEKITSFSQLIIHFKHLFHLKGDHSLRTVIEKINNSESFKELIDFKFSETQFWNNLELFTDVDKLIQAYKDILKMILEASKMNDGAKPVVGLEFYEENSKIFFSIHHINSVYQKTLTNTVERIGESQSNLIKTKINGLCDLFLKADFGHDVFALVNLWDGNERTSESIPEFIGVQYILKF